MTTLAQASTCRFDDFLLDHHARALFRLNANDEPILVSLGARAFDILCLLIERRGQFVSKREIMDAVWPGVTVEDSNLTVQMSGLRRVLDEGRRDGSCIRTVANRGYCFLPQVDRFVAGSTLSADDCSEPLVPAFAAMAPLSDLASKAKAALADQATPLRHWRRWSGLMFVTGFLVILSCAWVVWQTRGVSIKTADRPRLSVVVTPFAELDGEPGDDHLAKQLADDLLTGLDFRLSTLVGVQGLTKTYAGTETDPRRIGDESDVRYLLRGSIRHAGGSRLINARLVSGETGADLWSDRFEMQEAAGAGDQQQVIDQILDRAGRVLIETESARSVRERPDNPDTTDLFLRARVMQRLPQSAVRDQQVMALYERALTLDPTSVTAMSWVAYFLTTDRPLYGWNSFDDMQRAGALLARARSIAPDSELVLNHTIVWLHAVDRCPEVMELAHQAIQMNPIQAIWMNGIYTNMGACRLYSGHAEDDIALEKEGERFHPVNAWRYDKLWHMGFASLMLGRDEDAIRYLEQSQATNPDPQGLSNPIKRMLAAAYAWTGRTEKAKQALIEADRIWPFDTARSHWPDGVLSSVFAEQIRRYQDGLRLAGERDHADEDADFGVTSDGALHMDLVGLTPTRVPGAKTIRTPDLVRLLAEKAPLVIDTMTYSWHRSIPGAVGLQYSGFGGSFTDAAQARLREKLHALTNGDLTKPIVAVGFNSEWFDGRNLALRLLALGYREVYWYRGGREAWEVNNLPETDQLPSPW
jgi:adenylate cyclase